MGSLSPIMLGFSENRYARLVIPAVYGIALLLITSLHKPKFESVARASKSRRVKGD